jgi:hypothetical protein
MEHETFFTLLSDPAHWLFELTLMAVVDGLIGALIWPRLKRWTHHHREDDDKVAVLERQVKEMRAIMGLESEDG